jgi:predicted AlkP superfamily pyrophosphatase or phosphodiesterase
MELSAPSKRLVSGCALTKESRIVMGKLRSTSLLAFALLLLIVSGAAQTTSSAQAMPMQNASVVMISIDGMKPEAVTEADAHGLRVPYLRSVIRDGSYAEGVTGVWPTVTYPSHTTLLTGVWPAEHGIYSNTLFDPERKLDGAWYWYADQIRVPTLWQAAREAGLRTASIGWPVSVGAPVDYLIPEYWRGNDASGSANPTDLELIAALSRPDGLLAELQQRVGPYMMGNETTVEGDEIKTRCAIEILRAHKPALMTLHLSALDEIEHEHGPFSPEANQVLEAIDGMVARVAAAARESNPNAVILIVSDHGFAQLTHRVNLTIPFVKAGLIQLSDAGAKPRSVTAWKAQLWMSGGMVAVELHDTNDVQTARQVSELLHALAADPTNGIDSILTGEEIRRRGGFPDAAFVVVLKSGYYAGSEDAGNVVADFNGHGGHGFSPEFPEMRSSFFMTGPGVASHRDLGQIDMRQIAPTVAAILNVNLPSAKAAPLHVKP